MTTTLGQFVDALGALALVGAQEQGRHLYLTGQSYERCQTDAERDGWVAEWDKEIAAALGALAIVSEREPA